MAYTLADLTYRVAQELQITGEGTATGGSTSTILDTGREESNSYWKDGTAWVLYDAGALSAAPEGEMRKISSYTRLSGIITVSAVFTQAVASGDRYAVARSVVPMDILIQKVNSAIQSLRRVPVEDITTLDTASNQTEYTLPAAAKNQLRQVWLPANNDDSNDKRWVKIHNWRLKYSDTGSQDVLVFPWQPESGLDIRLVYVAKHPYLSIGTAKLSEYVPIERVVYQAALECYQWRKDRERTRAYDSQISELTRTVQQVKAEFPIRVPRRDNRLMIVSQASDLPVLNDDVNVVHLGS